MRRRMMAAVAETQVRIRRTKQCIDEGYFKDWDSSYQAMTEFLQFELKNEREKNNAKL